MYFWLEEGLLDGLGDRDSVAEKTKQQNKRLSTYVGRHDCRITKPIRYKYTTQSNAILGPKMTNLFNIPKRNIFVCVFSFCFVYSFLPLYVSVASVDLAAWIK